MDLSSTTTTYGNQSHKWLGSERGTQSTQSVTLKRSAFTITNGFIPDGTPIAKYTSGANTGLFGPYTAGATDGTQNLSGFLLYPVAAVSGGTANLIGAMLDTGRVIVASLPVAGIDATAQATNPRFTYV